MILFTQTAKLLEVLGFSKGKVLYTYAISQTGKVKSGIKAPKEYGCAEAVNRIFKECFGNEAGGDVSTARMYESIRSSYRFAKVVVPMPGDIVISPTGYGNGSLQNGHVGIVSEKGRIMSNSSATGLWEENYTIESWSKRYQIQGGFPVVYFRVVV